MAKALGTTPEEEYKPGLHKIAGVSTTSIPHLSLDPPFPSCSTPLQRIKGQVGLLLTSSPPDEVTAWFADFSPPDFARSGTPATRTIILPAGPVLQRHSDPPEPFPHNEEPQLRKLGLHTTMQRGVPTLGAPHTVCQKGKTLTPEQAQLLKLLGERTVKFRVGMRAWWSKESGEVVDVEGGEPLNGGGEEEENEVMSE